MLSREDSGSAGVFLFGAMIWAMIFLSEPFLSARGERFGGQGSLFREKLSRRSLPRRSLPSEKRLRPRRGKAEPATRVLSMQGCRSCPSPGDKALPSVLQRCKKHRFRTAWNRRPCSPAPQRCRAQAARPGRGKQRTDHSDPSASGSSTRAPLTRVLVFFHGNL